MDKSVFLQSWRVTEGINVLYVFKKTNGSNLGTWWGKNQEVGNPELSVLSVGKTLLSCVKISE